MPNKTKPLPLIGEVAESQRTVLAEKLLHEHFGYDSFRGIQREIIESIMSGKDTLGLMPTGGGKSITFQIPALACQGTCIVVTPLIALMKDQVNHLRKKGIKATAVYTGMTHEKVITALENCILGDYKLLYISPERICNELFQAKLAHMNVSFICIDEAHCISQWGYDFRPSYLLIKQIRKMVPHAPILALTATATLPVIDDIQQQLEFKQNNVFRMSFERKNLAYIVQKAEEKESAIKRLLDENEGSIIIYTRNRQQTKEYADKILSWGHTAIHYHAGLSNAEKDDRQAKWQDGKIRIMVSTNAFGMGIDKSDVRLVIHAGVPDSVEAYFQEAGRAGRDGAPARAILLYNSTDIKTLRRRVDEAFPTKEQIRQIYLEVCCYYELAIGFGQGMRKEFNLQDFCRKFRHFPTMVESALGILTKSGYIEYTDAEEGASRMMINVTRDELYHIPDTDKRAENILQALFRQYSGLFVHLVTIDESLIAKATSLTMDEVYHELKELNHRGIITFIPRKNIPHITFTRERRDAATIRIPYEVYEARRDNLQKRIEAMIGYLTEDDTCRSSYLLSYFGEKDTHPCGQCDICTEYDETGHPVMNLLRKVASIFSTHTTPKQEQYEKEYADIKQSLIAQLKEAGSIHPFMLDFDNYNEEIVKDVIKQMSDDGEIITDDTFRISLSKVN
ncbi:MAG: RecQ family ATP-dependent DNA helicase [Bacteroidaceae bacterium]|nr:RecQ family ATP-dependent DNA helicase [Bacteroidaceae bacterium]